jgi:hypothetical protein
VIRAPDQAAIDRRLEIRNFECALFKCRSGSPLAIGTPDQFLREKGVRWMDRPLPEEYLLAGGTARDQYARW